MAKKTFKAFLTLLILFSSKYLWNYLINYDFKVEDVNVWCGWFTTWRSWKTSTTLKKQLSAAKIWHRTFSFDTQTFAPPDSPLNTILTTNFSKICPYKISERTFRNRLRDIWTYFCFFCIILLTRGYTRG